MANNSEVSKSKLALVHEQMKDKNVDVFLFVSPQNRFWLTDFMSTEGYLLVTQTKVVLFVDGRYFSAAEKSAKVDEVRCLKSAVDVVDFLKDINAKSILVESEYMTVGMLEYFSSKVNAKFSSCESSRLRSAKTKTELAKITEAANIVCKIANRLKKYIKPGMTELAISKWISTQILKDSEKDSFDPIVASGVNGANPHHHSSNRKIQVGEFVTCDFGCIYDGYCSDLTRTYTVGQPKNTRLINAYKTVYKANQHGIAIASAKMTGCQVHEECQRVIDETEFKDYFLHSTGHGVGLDIHEFPYVAKRNTKLLEVNSVVTIEPGIYIAGLGGMRIEDMIIIKSNGNEHITKLAEVIKLK